MKRLYVILIWTALILALGLPIGIAATSPFLAWRTPIYIAGCFAGIFALTLLLIQPLLAMRVILGLRPRLARQLHVVLGAALVFSVIAHVGLLWITSPPDIIDALLFRSPTPFAPWGVVAMWAVISSALIAAFRRILRRNGVNWIMLHIALAMIVVVGTVIHATLIEGLMEKISKIALCALILLAAGWLVCKRCG